MSDSRLHFAKGCATPTRREKRLTGKIPYAGKRSEREKVFYDGPILGQHQLVERRKSRVREIGFGLPDQTHDELPPFGAEEDVLDLLRQAGLA